MSFCVMCLKPWETSCQQLHPSQNILFSFDVTVVAEPVKDTPHVLSRWQRHFPGWQIIITVCVCLCRGDTALHKAASEKQHAVCRLLVEAGASLEKTNFQVQKKENNCGSAVRHIRNGNDLQRILCSVSQHVFPLCACCSGWLQKGELFFVKMAWRPQMLQRLTHRSSINGGVQLYILHMKFYGDWLTLEASPQAL